MFSIIIPLYNKETYIIRTIQCILSQTFKYFELIIINDGSTDKSLDLAKSVKDDRIRIIDKTNGGVSSARNKGIMEAKYEYISFLDADDLWTPYFLEDIYSLISDFPKASVYSAKYKKIYINGKEEVSSHSLKRGYIQNYFRDVDQNIIIFSSSVVIRKNVFDEIDSFDERISRGEDMELWTRLGIRYTIAYSNNINVYYYFGAENSSSNFIPKPEQIFAYYIDLSECINYYHFKYLKKLLIKRTFRYLLLDHNLKYFLVMLKKQLKNIMKFYNYKFI